MSTYENSDYLKNFLLKGTELYYNHLKENNKGLAYTKITSVAYNEDENTYTLFFEQPIQDFSFVTHIKINDTKYNISKFQFVKTTLTSTNVIPYDDDSKLFETKHEMYLITDFTPLVQNVMYRYKSAEPILRPTKKASLSFTQNRFRNISFSDNQLKCINNIFNFPLSYVWGGAGSGKTRYVLSYSILSYILAGRKVILAAPTNYALENALYALLAASEEYNIPTSKILRMGTPSGDFINRYPECCRTSKYESEISEFTAQLALLDNFIKKKKLEDKINYIETHLNIWEQQNNNYTELCDLFNSQTLEQNLLSAKINQHKEILFNINAHINILNSKKRSLHYKIKKVLKKNEQIESQLNIQLSLLAKKQNYINDLVLQRDALKNEVLSTQKKCEELLRLIEKATADLLLNINSIARKKVYNTINPSHIKEIISKFRQETFQFFNEFQNLYTSTPPNNLKEACEHRKIIYDNLSSAKKDAENHENDISVYGCTLDTYITSKFPNISHIFLDEACYTSIAKTGTLFFQGCPITFLGDHMQLPPVAEMDKKDLHKNNFQAFIWLQNGIYTSDLFDLSPIESYNKFINNNISLPKNLSVSSLYETHRFGKNLAEVLNKYVYKTAFRSALDYDTKITVIDAPKGKKQINKRENIDEATAIKNYITENELSDFAILTPYDNQRKLLCKIMPTIKKNIMTIHKSQGQEWDTVIISVSDTENMFFTDSENLLTNGKQLLNTAISRAKKNLVIVCDAAFWASFKNQLIGALVRLDNQQYKNKGFHEIFTGVKNARVTIITPTSKIYSVDAKVATHKNNFDDDIRYNLQYIYFSPSQFLRFKQCEAKGKNITVSRVYTNKYTEVIDSYGHNYQVRLDYIK